jgi:hypothetical protein
MRGPREIRMVLDHMRTERENAKIHTSDKFCSFELHFVICQNSSGHAKSIYDAMRELNCCLLGYI